MSMGDNSDEMEMKRESKNKSDETTITAVMLLYQQSMNEMRERNDEVDDGDVVPPAPPPAPAERMMPNTTHDVDISTVSERYSSKGKADDIITTPVCAGTHGFASAAQDIPPAPGGNVGERSVEEEQQPMMSDDTWTVDGGSDAELVADSATSKTAEESSSIRDKPRVHHRADKFSSRGHTVVDDKVESIPLATFARGFPSARTERQSTPFVRAMAEEVRRLFLAQDPSVPEIAVGLRGFPWLVKLWAPNFSAKDSSTWATEAVLRYSHCEELCISTSQADEFYRLALSWGAVEMANAVRSKFFNSPHFCSTASSLCKTNRGGRYHHLKKLSKNYRLDGRILGHGLSGPVRLVAHRETGRAYALKTLILDNVSDEKRLNIKNEVDIYLRLDHPNIVKLLEVYEDHEPFQCVHLIMERCTGRELYDRLSDKKKYSEQDAARITKEMLSAIKYLHSRNIAHRDIKLENWLFESPKADAKLRLIDFGFSKLYNGEPFTLITGTVYYVSPEVIKGAYDLSCDLWSLGVVVYMLLSGRPPFYASTDAQVLSLIEQGRFSLTGRNWDHISFEAKNFVLSLLKTNPSERLTAASALLHPWILHTDHVMVEPVPIDPLVLSSLRSYAEANTLKRTTCSLIAYSLTMDEITDLEQQFKSLDMDNSGEIRFQDFCTILKSHLNLPPEEARVVFSRLRGGERPTSRRRRFQGNKSNSSLLSADERGEEAASSAEGGEKCVPWNENEPSVEPREDTIALDEDGIDPNETVQFTEFLAGALQARVKLDEQRLHMVFSRLDEDDSGYIDLGNLKSVLGEQYDGTKVEDILSEFGVEGKIHYDQFKASVADHPMRLDTLKQLKVVEAGRA